MSQLAGLSQARTFERLVELNPGGVGASTGYMARLRGDWPQALAAARLVSADVVELSALRARELPGLLAYLTAQGRPEFRHLSVHGPAKGFWQQPADLAHRLAREVPAFVPTIVMHPEELGDPEAFAVLGPRLTLENMDARKPDARTVEELDRFFTLLPEAAFCFDIAHAYANDPGMELAAELLDAFGVRLREVHVSSILSDGTHVPLSEEDLSRFEPLLRRCRGVPWVLEAPAA